MRKPDERIQHAVNNEKLPRGHAYIRMRNRGHEIEIGYRERDSAQAQRIIETVLAILKKESE